MQAESRSIAYKFEGIVSFNIVVWNLRRLANVSLSIANRGGRSSRATKSSIVISYNLAITSYD